MEILFYIVLPVLLLISIGLNVALGIMIRGAIRREPLKKSDLKFLTGRQIEEMKRRVNLIGINGTDEFEVLCLINTMNGVQLGVYQDEDVWIPNEPYEDLR